MRGLMDGWYEDVTLCWKNDDYICNCSQCMNEIDELMSDDYFIDEHFHECD